VTSTGSTENGARIAGPFAVRPSGADVVVLGVAVLGVSASGPLIASMAVPALAIALWRNVLGTAALAPLALVGHHRELRSVTRRNLWLTALAGVALAAHFATWIPAVTLTSVASATALGATQPAWNAVIARMTGHAVPRRAWLGIALAIGGVLLLTGVDVSVSRDALVGDLLALAGGAFVAVYVALGGTVRRTMSTTTYAALCYGFCSLVLLVVCLVAGVALRGYSAEDWWKLVALTVLAQLVGHTLLNKAVGSVGPMVVSLAILFEVPGAALIAALWLGQEPAAAAIPAALLILAGVALVVTARPQNPRDVD